MSNMTNTEKRAIFSLSSIMGLRMLGLFMVLPVFSIYIAQLKGATPFLIGLAIGIYGLSQAVLQIPFGSLSDRFGRKPIAALGLILFIIGSLLAGLAHTVTAMIIGRALQGCGAIGSTLLAMLADLTREEQRTRAMAAAGITIGLSFSLSILCGPLLMKWMPVNVMFFLAAILGIVCITILFSFAPTPCFNIKQPNFNINIIVRLFTLPELTRLNIGILLLHAIFTASFIVIPVNLLHFNQFALNQQWMIYLPALLISFSASLICMQRAEKNQQIKFYFLIGIALITAGLILLCLTPYYLFSVSLGLTMFLMGFSLLESFLPSLVSRIAPPEHKGSALGIYSCAQFSGIFMGGVSGGWLYGQFGFAGVYVFCLLLALSWFAFALSMQQPSFKR
jgi:MFS family permease